MGRKKKVVEEEKPFIPSKYQEAIFNHIQHNVGNLVISAAAGAGKTSTLVRTINLINKDKSILFCAFNKDIVKDIQKRVKGNENVDVRTIHSLGYKILTANLYPQKAIPDDMKYRKHLYDHLKEYTTIDTWSMGRKLYNTYFDNILKLVDYFRCNMCHSFNDAMDIVIKHDIDLVADEIDVTYKVLEWGKNNLETIDYDDMVWIPLVNNYRTTMCQYDYIFCDEAQDLSTAQRQIVQRCHKINTRYVFCGDGNQAIYAFASASPEAFKNLSTIPNTTSLPLSVSYRCAKNIVKFVKQFVPSIEPNDDGREGEVKFKCKIEEIMDGDMVVCRNNAPLVQLYSDLLKLNKKCFIRGKDIGSNLKDILKNIEQEELNVNLRKDGVFVQLYNSLFELRDKIMSRNGIDEKMAMLNPLWMNRLDMIRTLEILADGINTKTELIDKITNIFSDKKKEGIALSTIHKAKGLEADRVFILCNFLIPSKSAHLPWEFKQEENLKYVAYTRAKNFLGFIDDADFEKFNDEQGNSMKLSEIEAMVNIILRKSKNKGQMSIEYAKEIIKNANPITIPSKKNTISDLSSIRGNQNIRSLSSLGQRKLIKVIK